MDQGMQAPAADKAKPSKPGIDRKYLLGAGVIIVLIVLAYLTRPTAPIKQSSTSVPSSVFTTVQIFQTTSISPNTTTTIAPLLSTVYCVGGESNPGAYTFTNAAYYADFFVKGSSSWLTIPSYPISIDSLSCFNANSSITCLGGLEQTPGGSYLYTNASYNIPISQNLIGNWGSSASYPQAISSTQCVTSYNNVYCVGGANLSGISKLAFYAPVTEIGAGKWQKTTPYPISVFKQSCVEYNNYAYCVGGSSNSNATSSTYYAALGTSGIGQWQKTTSYPINASAPTCFQSGGYIYCIGSSPSAYQNNIAPAYYAPVGPSGIGQWHSTTEYPQIGTGMSCTTNDGYVFCVGGNSATEGSATNYTYYAQLSTLGIGPWLNATSYPTQSTGHSCAIV